MTGCITAAMSTGNLQTERSPHRSRQAPSTDWALTFEHRRGRFTSNNGQGVNPGPRRIAVIRPAR